MGDFIHLEHILSSQCSLNFQQRTNAHTDQNRGDPIQSKSMWGAKF